MENNFKEWLQFILFLGGIIYYVITEFKKYKKQKFVCKKSISYFIIGAFGMTFGLILIAYVVYCLMVATVIKEYLLLLFLMACTIIPIFGYLYFTSLVNEANFKQNIHEIILPAEYVFWQRMRYFGVFLGVIMLILFSAYLLIR